MIAAYTLCLFTSLDPVLDRTVTAALRTMVSRRRLAQSQTGIVAVADLGLDFGFDAMNSDLRGTESVAGNRQRHEHTEPKSRAPRRPCKAIRYAQRAQVSR